jgi:hypothetical protein
MFIPPRIPDPDPVVKKAPDPGSWIPDPDPGSWIPDPDPQHCLYMRVAQRKLTETDGRAFYATD